MKPASEGQMFSDPGNDAAVMAAWERYLRGEPKPTEALRFLIDLSWQRCHEANVDPAKRQAPAPLPAARLESLKEHHGELLEASAPVMACARDFLSETGTVMALADTRCTILSMEGDAPTIDRAESIHLLPGASWSEMICGTNAIGTALEVGQPVQIHSAEHYCAGIKRWTCSATVIRHPQDGEIIGVVDVSGLSESYSRQSLALVVTTASRIESRLAMREMELRYRLLDASMRRWSAAGFDGLVLFDRRGYPVKANENALTAVAALGGGLNLARPARIPGLSLDQSQRPPLPGSLPPWIRLEWLEPITEGGERLGTLLAIPLPRIRGLASRQESARSAVQDARSDAFAPIITADAGITEAVGKARQLAKSRVPVLLLGETGVGKEEFALGIHRASGRDGPFVALNCGGLSRELLASELFGYVDGAFTGARRGGLVGKIEAANGGTLFLDEIGEMPFDLQPHLLRVLEQGEIYRLGDNVPRKVSFRLVAATNRDLRKEVAEGRFRMDFYYRVAVTTIRIPPLRERKGDIRPLVQHFLARFGKEHGVEPRRCDDSFISALERQPWPGNVRELRNVIESALLMSDSEPLTAHDLPRELLDAGEPPAARPLSASVQSIEEGERELIRRAIAATRGNLTLAARELNIAKSTLYLKMKRYGLERESGRAGTG